MRLVNPFNIDSEIISIGIPPD
ncbi:protein of unknown function [Shewanella benthica]|uniref:Uncharacterized protein n=1 Tax=Shewanella benthica TaxID=43661 RepID=A0A330LZF4_9GAMM|nr:protein of unknown function [Shewanella benthica]